MKVVAKNMRMSRYQKNLTQGKIYHVIKSSNRMFSILDDFGLVLNLPFRKVTPTGIDWTIIGNPAIAVPNG